MRSTLGSLIVLALAFDASALPIIAIDVDPSSTGVQASREITVGSQLTIDIVISGVDASSPLQAFELDVDFIASILTAISVIDGGFLVTPLIVVEANVAAPDVNFAEATLGAVGASGSGTLASIQFDAVGIGISILELNDVILSAPFGVPIPIESLSNATINVVPEPATGLLLASTMLLLGHRKFKLHFCSVR